MNFRYLGIVIAIPALLAVAGCGTSSSDANKAWNYTDDRGEAISLDAAPNRIVAQSSMAAALTDLGVKGIVGTFGPLKNADGSTDRQADGLDPANVEDVTGEGDYGDVNLEKLATLRPDLIATYQYLPKQLWYISPSVEPKIEKLAPTAVVDFQGKTLVQTLDATEQLAKSLGANPNAARVKQAHRDFAAAGDRLRVIAKKLSDKKIIAVSAATDTFYVSDPSKSPDLAYYKDILGLPIVRPTGLKSADYFEALSWENADRYGGDIALYDARIGAAGLKLFESEPVWQKVAAGRNKAYVPWQSVAPPSYAAYARIMNEIADGLAKQL